MALSKKVWGKEKGLNKLWPSNDIITTPLNLRTRFTAGVDKTGLPGRPGDWSF